MPMKIAKAAFATFAILFLVAPLIAILPLAFTSSVILTYPIPSWSLRWFEELFFADAWRRAIVNSLIIGGGTTVLATVLGTLASLGPWLVATSFALYSSQWLAVIGFLPVIYAAAGVGATATGVLTALAAAVNMIGNLGAGRLLQRGVRPPRLLATGFVAMALAAAAAFSGASGEGLPPLLRYAAVQAVVLATLASTLGGIGIAVYLAQAAVAIAMPLVNSRTAPLVAL